MNETERSVAFATLGCKLNQFETDSIATRLRDSGYRVVDFAEPADVCVINSCTVTNRADRKSRNLLYRAERQSSGDSSLVVLTGCFVDSHRDELESDGRTYIVPNEQKQSIPELVDGHFRGEITHPAGSVFDFPLPDRIFHTRSTIKVQDGCDNFCTFCIIPFVRGRAQSRPAGEVLAAVREAVEGGAKEIVLTGVNMSRYRDGEVDFTELASRCLDVEKEYRLRISSLEPDQLTDRFLELFAHPRMAPHLHLCLQSGSERVLLAMRRQYTAELYTRLARALRERDPLFNLTTDIIVGFPGETDADFESSLRAVAELGFGHVHTFPYSVRAGTRAARLQSQVASRAKKERAARIREAGERSKRAYRERLVGLTERMLVERVEERDDRIMLSGLGEHYVPIRVEVARGDGPARNDDPRAAYENCFLDVRLLSLEPGDDPSLLGVIA